MLSVRWRKGERRPQEEALEEVRARKGPENWSGLPRGRPDGGEEAGPAAAAERTWSGEADEAAVAEGEEVARTAGMGRSTRTELVEEVRFSWSRDLESRFGPSPSPATAAVALADEEEEELEEEEFLFLLFCSNRAVSSVLALRLVGPW